MDFDRLEAIQLERHDMASRRFLNIAGGCRHVEAMDQPLRNTNCLKFPLKGLLQLAESFRHFQRGVFFSP